MIRRAVAICLCLWAMPLWAQTSPLRIEITDGVIEPMPVAIPQFEATTPESVAMARRITDVLSADLVGTGLFRTIDPGAFIAARFSFTAAVRYADWKAINAQALIAGAVTVDGEEVTARFSLHDVFAERALGDSLELVGTTDAWRRIAHKIADEVYSRITGEGPYFDSQVTFVSESGPKDDRRKRLAVMDYDGQNLRYLTDSAALVLAPRFSPDGRQILYTSYESGFPRIQVMDTGTLRQRSLESQEGTMSFAPRFSPDGRRVAYSLSQNGNTDIYVMDLTGGTPRRLTYGPAIDTAPSFSPDGRRIVFESDRSGSQQLYIMQADGGEARRISRGQERYGTPVWSPRGDLIAFTKQTRNRFHIGVMRIDGSEERLLTASFLDEGPSWAPNGRVVMFTRETQGADGRASLYSVDITGRNLRRVPTPEAGSDPSWGPLRP